MGSERMMMRPDGSSSVGQGRVATRALRPAQRAAVAVPQIGVFNEAPALPLRLAGKRREFARRGRGFTAETHGADLRQQC